MSEDFSAAEPLLAEYADIEAEMAGPAAADPGAMRRLGRRYAELGRVVSAYRAWQSASADLGQPLNQSRDRVHVDRVAHVAGGAAGRRGQTGCQQTAVARQVIAEADRRP